ncbi:MAG: HAD family hydrolase, partial [Sulfitobacter sp.]|nr:HAD family hydrolase [Sulfitobacter sp.]
MTKRLTMIGFDADDTLWHNEHYFVLTQDRFADLLRDHTDPDTLMDRLLVAERRNIPHYGFGIKGFTLSMVETAIDVTDGKVPAPVIAEILNAGREMLSHPVDLLPHAQETLEALQGR